MTCDVERIRREVRLEELVVRLGGAPLRPVGGELHGPCPRCGGADRFVVFRSDPPRWYCRRCDVSGDAIDLVRHVRGCSWREAVRYLGYEAPARPRETARETLRRTFALPERPDGASSSPSAAYEAELARLEPLAPDGVAYLEERRIPIDLALEAGVMYSPAFLGRPSVTFPLVDAHGPCGLSARRIGTVDPREKARTLRLRPGGVFATPGALEAEVVPVLVEGPIDALSVTACGYPAVATIGTALPDWLAGHLAYRPVVLGHDADQGGDQAAERAATRLRQRGCAVRRVPPPRKDWNDALREGGPEAIRAVLEAAGLRARVRDTFSYDPLAPDGDAARHPQLVLALLEAHGASVHHAHGRWIIRNGGRIDPLLARHIRDDWPAVARYLDRRAALERPYMA